jgi:hypothetical protein
MTAGVYREGAELRHGVVEHPTCRQSRLKSTGFTGEPRVIKVDLLFLGVQS